MKPAHVLLVDPIAYPGGSKVATAHMLDTLDRDCVRLTIVSRDPASWSDSDANLVPLREPDFLSRRDRGIGYFLRHACIVFSILRARLRHGRFDRALGASGPGVDLSLYLAQRLLGYDIIQLVHGPVAKSKTIGRALDAAHRVFYLEAAGESLQRALATVQPETRGESLLDSNRFSRFDNGLPRAQWPSPCRPGGRDLFWAASLLKWKGLDVLVDALRRLSPEDRPRTRICYIRPADTNLETSTPAVRLERVQWHENPENLDQLRAACNIFVSTSRREPFGLSILEAMAAGLAVVIPRDGAFWDQRLVDREHCLKYRADDPSDLAMKLHYLGQNPSLVAQLGEAARRQSAGYSADLAYREISSCLAGSVPGNALDSSTTCVEADHARG